MGNTLWVLKEGQEDDDWDHSLILIEEKGLSRLAKDIGVRKLNDFYDYSILNEEFDGPDTEPNYVNPKEVKETLMALIEAIKDGNNSGLNSPNDLTEELEDCLKKVIKAENGQCNVRLSIIP